jgi:hypothetical protein
MVIVEVVVHDRWTAVDECPLIEAKPFITDAIGTLPGLHQERKTVRAGQRFGARLPFVAKNDHEVDGFDPSLQDFVGRQALRLVAEKLGHSCALWNGNIDLGFLVFFLLHPLCLPLDIPRRPVVEIVLAVSFDDLPLTLRPPLTNLIGELSDLVFVFKERPSSQKC